MWKVLGLSLLFVVAHGGFLDVDREKLMNPRLLVNAARIYRLDKALEQVKEDLKEAAKFHPEDCLTEVENRVEDLEEGHCPYTEFQCGYPFRQCIYDLKVCDGVKDCINGRDEDEDTCSMKALAVGNAFDLHVTWTACENFPDQILYVRVKEFTNFKIIGSRARVSVDISKTPEARKHSEFNGYYNFGTSELTLYTKYEKLKNYKFICDFVNTERGKADCYIETLSGVECGFATLTDHH